MSTPKRAVHCSASSSRTPTIQDPVWLHVMSYLSTKDKLRVRRASAGMMRLSQCSLHTVRALELPTLNRQFSDKHVPMLLSTMSAPPILSPVKSPRRREKRGAYNISFVTDMSLDSVTVVDLLGCIQLRCVV